MERILAHILLMALPVACGRPTTTSSKDLGTTTSSNDLGTRQCAKGEYPVYSVNMVHKKYDWLGLVPPPDLAVPVDLAVPRDLAVPVDLAAPPPDLRAVVDMVALADAGGASDGGSRLDGGSQVDGGSAQSTTSVRLPDAQCPMICGTTTSELTCFGEYASDGSPQVRCDERSIIFCRPPSMNCGRRPEGLADVEVEARETPGGYLAKAAFLEAASVSAFRRLAIELRAHGAPRRLVDEAMRAAGDEVRHARSMGRLARRYQATVPKLQPTDMKIRALEAIALENAVEGCIYETYGAMTAAAQARLAGDKVVRAALRRIATDEARHAALSWEVARFCQGRLDLEAQQRIAQAQQRAVTELMITARCEPATEVMQHLGIPAASLAQALVAGLHAELWQQRAA